MKQFESMLQRKKEKNMYRVVVITDLLYWTMQNYNGTESKLLLWKKIENV
jgi:hypothetical protein